MSAVSQQTDKRSRIAEIEERVNTRLADLLYQMHWEENLMHREIAERVGIPRPTITRWFSELGVPSQPSERITKTYLTSWAYITGQKKPKPRYQGPKRSRSFLDPMRQALKKASGLIGGCVTMGTRASRLQYSITDSARLFHLMYSNLDHQPFLHRKRAKFCRALHFLK